MGTIGIVYSIWYTVSVTGGHNSVGVGSFVF